MLDKFAAVAGLFFVAAGEPVTEVVYSSGGSEVAWLVAILSLFTSIVFILVLIACGTRDS